VIVELTNPLKPGIRNSGLARHYTGDREIAVYHSHDGYVPVQVEGWSAWARCQDVFGFNVYICEQEADHES